MQLVLIIQKCAQCVWKRLLRANIYALYDFHLRFTFVSFTLYNHFKTTRTEQRDLNLLRSAEVEDCYTKWLMAGDVCSEFGTLITFL
jgi:hypothetical protein